MINGIVNYGQILLPKGKTTVIRKNSPTMGQKGTKDSSTTYSLWKRESNVKWKYFVFEFYSKISKLNNIIVSIKTKSFFDNFQ